MFAVRHEDIVLVGLAAVSQGQGQKDNLLMS